MEHDAETDRERQRPEVDSGLAEAEWRAAEEQQRRQDREQSRKAIADAWAKIKLAIFGA